jgi:hypothetical protein
VVVRCRDGHLFSTIWIASMEGCEHAATVSVEGSPVAA